MATSNQIAWKQAQETERANRQNEKLKGREVKEKETMGKFNRAKSIVEGTAKAIGKGLAVLNDPQWYSEDPQLVKDVASISFNNPIGNAFNTELGSEIAPGVMVLPWVPTIGRTSGASGRPIADITAKNIYAYVRHANSGSRNYEAVDLMLYILAMDQAYSYWAWMRRIYSLLLTAKAHNRYYNKAMVQAAGGMYDNLIDHIADFRAYINAFAIRLNSFYLPTGINYITRHSWLNTHIFKDAPIEKSQEYMFVQDRFLRYRWSDGRLTTQFGDEFDSFRGTTPQDIDSIKGFGNDIIAKLMDSEDIGIISGDILKAYGENNMYFVPSTPEDYHIESTYSPEVLTQIHNAKCNHLYNDVEAFKDSVDIYQVNGDIVQGKPYYNSNTDTNVRGYAIPVDNNNGAATYILMPNYNKQILNMFTDKVSPDDVMVATRFCEVLDTAFFETGTETRKDGLYVASMGSEIMLCPKVYKYVPGTYAGEYILNITDFGYNEYYESMLICLDYPREAIDKIRAITPFTHHPAVYVAPHGYSTDLRDIVRLMNLDNYTTLTVDSLDNINYVAMLSLFGVPKLGLHVRTR